MKVRSSNGSRRSSPRALSPRLQRSSKTPRLCNKFFSKVSRTLRVRDCAALCYDCRHADKLYRNRSFQGTMKRTREMLSAISKALFKYDLPGMVSCMLWNACVLHVNIEGFANQLFRIPPWIFLRKPKTLHKTRIQPYPNYTTPICRSRSKS